VLEAPGGQNHPAADNLVAHPDPDHGAPVESEAAHARPGAHLDAGSLHPGQQGTDEGPAPDRSPQDHTGISSTGILSIVILSAPLAPGAGLVGGDVDAGLDVDGQGHGARPQRPAPVEGSGISPR